VVGRDFYDLHVAVSPADSSIRGWNAITYRALKPSAEMQIDLQVPLEVDSVVQSGSGSPIGGRERVLRGGSVAGRGASATVTVFYHGNRAPRCVRRGTGASSGSRTAPRPALDRDGQRGPGASVWWLNKDYLADEPDSQRIAITLPDSMVDVSNGRLRATTHNSDGTTTYEWFVEDPINNYDVEVNAGQYAHWSDTFNGESGPLTLDFWPLSYHADTAKVQFQQAKSMLACFEHWFGPYPWYRTATS
jgi:hypothetical protein